jgi:hypothetical protein
MKRRAVPAPARNWVTAVLALLFAIGLVIRAGALRGEHLESDEQVYRALVVQLLAHHGYNLIGTGAPPEVLPPAMYGKPLFYHHPPGGIVFFAALLAAFGPPGFGIAQLIAYAAYFFGLLRLRAAAFGEGTPIERLTLAALAALSPIGTHVGVHHWLDGPVLAAATLAAAPLLTALRKRDIGRAALAGALLGLASWIKVPALLVLPGVALMAWGCEPGLARDPRAWRSAAIACVGSLAILAPWEIWQWIVLGPPWLLDPGKPTADLVRTNPFEHYVVVERSAWAYLPLLVTTLWSLVPSSAITLGTRGTFRRSALALLGWMAIVVIPHMVLGARGYPKLLRFVILATPAAALLASLAVRRLAEVRAEGRVPAWWWAACAALTLGLALEISHGVAAVVQNQALILPLFP